MTRALSVAVVSYNTRDLTLRCLEAATRATRAWDPALTLVDNGSTDGTVETVRRARPEWRVIVRNDNPGYGAALNLAFRARPAERLLALNSDALVDAVAVDRLVDFLARHPSCGVVGPVLRYPDGTAQPSAKRFPGLAFAVGEVFGIHALLPDNRWARRFYYADAGGVPARVDTVSGAVLLLRGRAFEQVGGFDEGYRMYFEETDLCRRLVASGVWVALCADATVMHCHAASTRATSVRQVEYYLSYLRFFEKHGGALRARGFAGVLLLATALRMLALPVAYPPVSAERGRLLGGKLSACLRLLGGIVGGGASRRPAEGRP